MPCTGPTVPRRHAAATRTGTPSRRVAAVALLMTLGGGHASAAPPLPHAAEVPAPRFRLAEARVAPGDAGTRPSRFAVEAHATLRFAAPPSKQAGADGLCSGPAPLFADGFESGS